MAYWIDLAYDHREPEFEFEDTPSRTVRFGFSLGLPTSADLLPSIAKEVSNSEDYPDIFTMPGLNAVSSNFRDIVEYFEPGIHQFFPLKLMDNKEKKILKKYYIFNCTTSIDSLLVEQSNISWIDLDNPSKCPKLSINFHDQTVLSKKAIKGFHIWSYFRIRVSGVYVSDSFYSEMKSNNITFFRSNYCDELSLNWSEKNVQPILDWERIHGYEPGMKPWLVNK